MSFHVVNEALTKDLRGTLIGEDASILTKTSRAVTAVGEWLAGGARIADNETKARRETICLSCPYWNSAGNLGLGECRAPGCGCTKAKLYLATSRCTHPDGPRW